tara:strand:+ start:69 stop:686 length:618 start_codon:yes stop_codon:yes gene_type:complete
MDDKEKHNLIWNSNYKMPSDLRDRIKNRIKEDHVDKTTFYSSFGTKDKYSDLLIPYYSEVIKDMMLDLGMFKRSQYNFNLWCQMYNSDTDSHNLHAHFTGREIISFTHIIDGTKQKCFYFIDDNDNKIYHSHQESGDIFAFPPWRLHAVDPVEEKGIDRLIVAGNIILKFYHRPEDNIVGYSEKVDSNQYMWRSGTIDDMSIRTH